VSDPNSTFTVKIDGTVQNNAAIHVGHQTDGGYTWYMELPAEITSGVEHFIEVTANANGRDSNTVSSTFTIESGSGAVIIPSGSDPLLQQLSATLTQPFVIPAGLDAASFVPVKMNSDTYNRGVFGTRMVKDPVTDTKSVPVAATDSGWKLLGLYWYWWAAFGMVLTGTAAWMTTYVRKQTLAMDV
jgi:hypothetical protein